MNSQSSKERRPYVVIFVRISLGQPRALVKPCRNAGENLGLDLFLSVEYFEQFLTLRIENY